MDPIAELFDRLDAWRHFPDYQLERRADIFFSLYLAEVLEAKLGFAVRRELVPEFPLRIGTINSQIASNQSKKIDYLAVSEAGDACVFVELKTDGGSRREAQDQYLLAAQAAGLPALLEGLYAIFRVTKSKRKYFALLRHLEHVGLLSIPDALKEIMAGPSLRGASAAADAITITAPSSRPCIVYVQPTGDDPNVISFREFADVVGRHEDPTSQRFATSLREWASVQAGR